MIATAWRVHTNSQGGVNEMEQEPSVDEQIRTRAYYLWEHAAEPKGTPEQYWEQARGEIEKEAPPVESGPVSGDTLK
jgi:hypothetical protein